MHIHDERLPSEDLGSTELAAGEKMVRLTITSRHVISRRFGPGISLFGKAPDYVKPEPDFPEGFSPDAIAEFDAPPYDGDYDEEEASEEEELFRRIEELMASLGDAPEEEDEADDTYVFKTLGRMRRSTDSAGNETVELEYVEGDGMEDTRTILAFTPSQNNRVSIVHDGPVMTGFVCERGVRHISTYQTPIMPFEIAVYTKHCEGSLSYDHGGFLELDYLVELRGMDIQRTHMTIDAVCIGE